MKFTKYKFTIYLLCLAAFLTFSNKVLAQSTIPVPNVVPPSPDAASLGKFGDIPVDKYHGLPTIDVPLYTIKSGDITIPISLSYHGGGIKVEERAGWVGLSWALNAGGMITRSIVGLPDEGSSNKVGYLNNPYDIEHISTLADQTKIDIATKYKQGLLDNEPDIFFYNVGGMSGKFTINRLTHQVDMIPKNNVSITYTSNLSGWTIIDEKGFKYDFSSVERSLTELNVKGAAPTNVITGWYLKSITSPTHHVVTFNYQTYTTEINQRKGVQKRIFAGGDSQHCSLNSTEYDESFNTNTVFGLRVSSIQFENGLVKFIKSSTGRDDIAGDYALDSVKVYNYKNKPIKVYKFNYSYYTEVLSGGENVYSGESLKRLQLTGIDDINPVLSTDKQSYTFGYTSNSLPYIFSNSQDHWGYYNGQNNSMLVPNYNYLNYGGANRVAYGSYATRGVLSRITYPTGGYTDYKFEMNEVLVDTLKYRNFFQTSDFANPLNVPQQFYGITINNAKKRDTITVDPNAIGSIALFNFNVVLPSNLNCDGRGKDCLGSFQVFLTKLTGNHPGNAGGELTSRPVVNGQIRDTIYLSKGDTYELEMQGPVSVVQGTKVALNSLLSPVIFRNGIAYRNLGVGGLRIASIVNHPVTGLNDTVTYNYVDSLNFDKPVPKQPYSVSQYFSTGRLIYFPKYENLTQSASTVQGGITYLCYVNVIGSNSQAPLSNFAGETVGYNFVQETHKSGAIKLKSVAEYKGVDDFSDLVSYDYPYTIIESFPYKRGLEKRTAEYTQTNGNYILVKEKLTSYTFPSTSYSYVSGLAIGSNSTSSTQGVTTGNTIFRPYKISSQRVLQSQVVETNYDTNGQNPVSTTQNFYYDNPVHYQLTRTRFTDSRGNIRVTKQTYPQDYGSGNTVLNALITQNRIDEVIEKRDSLYYQGSPTGYISAASVSNYRQLTSGALALDKQSRLDIPKAVSDFVGMSVNGNTINQDNRYRQQINFDAYDGKDNIAQYTIPGQLPVSILWDYQALYPIAQVKSADTLSIAYTSFEAEGTGHWIVGSTLRDNTNAITGANSYNLSNGSMSKASLTAATTYVVSYWTRNTGPVTIVGTISGFPLKGATINGWTNYTHQVTGQTTITLSGAGNIDEVRLYPLGAQMTTYTYDPLVGVTSINDFKNQINYYEYDGFQRLINIRNKDGNVVKHTDYHFLGQ